jgi:hypothetical protein
MTEVPTHDHQSPPPRPSATVEAEESTHATPISQQNKPTPKEPFYKRLTFWNVVFAFALTVTTICLAFIAYWQYEATSTATQTSQEALRLSQESYQISERSLKVSEEALHKSERAWLTPKQIRLMSPLAVGSEFVVAIEVQNSGHSPALKVFITHNLSAWEKLPDGPMPKMKVPGLRSQAVIGPNTTMTSSLRYPKKITDADMALLQSGKISLVTYGEIKYRDIFDMQHRTIFCYQLLDIKGIDLSSCDRWNHAD